MMYDYKIAGLNVKMDVCGRTQELALPFQIHVDAQPDITIEPVYGTGITESEEYILTGREFYHQLIGFSGMVLHASAVVKDEKAYLFCADSGGGKSTHTKLWRQLFGDDNVRILNDDKPALRLEDNRWYAYGTPWSGKYGLSLNLRYPVAGICFLEKAEKNKIEKYTKNDLVFQFMKQTYRPPNMRQRERLLLLLDDLLGKIPIWYMECNMEPEAAHMSCHAMTVKEC